MAVCIVSGKEVQETRLHLTVTNDFVPLLICHVDMVLVLSYVKEHIREVVKQIHGVIRRPKGRIGCLSLSHTQ